MKAHIFNNYGHFGPNLIPNFHPWGHAIYKFGKGLLSPSKYSFSFNKVSLALKNMLFKCFTYKHYIPNGPHSGVRTSTSRIIEFTILLRTFLLYMTLVYLSIFVSFCCAPTVTGCRSQFRFPSPRNASS